MTTEMIATFAPPTPEFVEYALRELGWEDRLVGFKMTPSAGNAACDMYNLPQAVLFLVGTPWDAPMLNPGFKGALNWVDVGRLVEWLGSKVGDAELADAIAERATGLTSYRAQNEVIGELITERMLQYQEALKAVREVEDGEGGEAAPESAQGEATAR